MKIDSSTVTLEQDGDHQLLVFRHPDESKSFNIPQSDESFDDLVAFFRAWKVLPNRAYVLVDDKDRHGTGCQCGTCNFNGHSYGAAIFDLDTNKLVERLYAASEPAAEQQAQRWAKSLGYVIVDDIPEETLDALWNC